MKQKAVDCLVNADLLLLAGELRGHKGGSMGGMSVASPWKIGGSFF